MALEVFKCENCGARQPPPLTTVKMIVCDFCKNAMLNPFFTEPAPVSMPSPVPVSVPSPAPVAPAAAAPPAGASMQPMAQPGRTTRPRTGEEIAKLAQLHLKMFDSLFHAPTIPPGKEQGARKGYGALIPAGEPILSLFDSTLFGGADDGFVVTPLRFGWKNIALDPKVMPWEMLDVSTVKITKDDVKLMGDAVQIAASSELQPRLVSFLHAMAAPVYVEAAPTPSAPLKGADPVKTQAVAKPQAEPAKPQPAPVPVPSKGQPSGKGASSNEPTFTPSAKSAAASGMASGKGRGSAEPMMTKGSFKTKAQVAEEEEEGDRESWLEATVEFAGTHFQTTDTLFVHPDIPRDKLRAARQSHSGEMADDDDIAVVYDSTVFGGAEDGFVITPYGLFWKNIGDDARVVWWEDLDMDEVELDGGTLTIEGDEVQINSDAKGLPRQLYRMMQEMTDWAQGE